MTRSAVMTADLRRQKAVMNSSGGYCSQRTLATDRINDPKNAESYENLISIFISICTLQVNKHPVSIYHSIHTKEVYAHIMHFCG